MGPANRYAFDNPAYDNQNNPSSPGGKKKSGCHVTIVTGFILLLLAILIAVGVGIIVHFAGNENDPVCQCDTNSGAASADAIKQECVEMASSGDMDICTKCPPDSTMATASTPLPTSTTTTTTIRSTETTPSAATTQEPEPLDFRLPDSVVPLHYDLELQSNVYTGNTLTFAFRGRVNILIQCVTSTDNIILHGIDINISGVEFAGELSITYDPVYVSHDTDIERQFLIIRLSRNMIAGTKYILGINFTSPLREEPEGIYYTSYTKLGQTVRYLATTQFFPAYARKAFPCFDEPSLKATFDLTLIRPQGLASVSNTPLVDSNQTINERGITWVKDVYQRSPKMSTYSLAFVVSDFQYIENVTRDNVRFRIWSQPDLLNHTRSALDVGVNALTTLVDYINVSYPLTKLDLVALPEWSRDVAGNLGLSLNSETSLLHESEASNERNRYNLAMEVSKRLASQWLSGVVTVDWWDDLWVSNGFATFLQHMAVDLLYPDWKVFDNFVVDAEQEAFSLDGFDLSRPVYTQHQQPKELDQVYGVMFQKKVASLFRMTRHFLGEDTFRKGVQTYFSNLAFLSASHDAVWLTFEWQARQEGKFFDVDNIMNTWTKQRNYPVVTFSIDASTPGSIYVQQERFRLDPWAEDPGIHESPFGDQWSIPLTLTSNKNPGFTPSDIDVHWLFKDETGKYLGVGQHNLPDRNDTDGWILGNVNQLGYYRANYQLGNWLNLASQLKRNYQVISPLNRARIISDVWNLANARYIPQFDTALIMSDYLHAELDYLPWAAAKKEMDYVGRMLSLDANYGLFQNFMQDKLNSSYQFYGLTNTGASRMETYARELIADQACKYGVPKCLADASGLFEDWMMNSDINPIDSNMKRVVYCHAIANGGLEEWEFSMQAFTESTSEVEKEDLLLAMTCTQKPWLLNDYLTKIISTDSPIPRRHVPRILTAMTSTAVGRLLVWNFYKVNFDALKLEFGREIIEWTNLFRALTNSFNTQSQLDELKAFVVDKTSNLGTLNTVIDLSMERISENIKWMTQFAPQVGNWLRTNGY